ncbi:MAG: serine hydrolase [Bacteroidetes bacterium]|nr:MAG: serine hydrolase [Bacteroidota bacterium]
MKSYSILFTILIGLVVGLSTKVSAQYFPAKGESWQIVKPAKVGLKEKELLDVVKFAEENEYSGSRDLRVAILEGFAREPYHDVLGPTRKRGGPAGMIIKDGYVVAQWGDIKRVDMTFSATKSYLSTVAGLAVDKGLIRVDDYIKDYVWDNTYEGEHNAKITWDHMLTQSSDWSGSLFGSPDWSDRPPREGGVDDWKYRELHEPGTFFKYNDVRVNVLSYSLLQVWRKPLPQVLKENIMDPIGASTTWRWMGYDHAWVDLDGQRMQSVTGGGHSGGGVFISAEDHARFGLLFLNEGNWQGNQVISKEWVTNVQKSSAANASYGYMWWLNRGSRKWDGIDDESIYFAAGFGGNYVVVDKTNNMVIVTRWLEPNKLGDFMLKLKAAIK